VLPIGGLIAGAGVVGFVVGFGAQGIVSDVVTGCFILTGNWSNADDNVITGCLDGVVVEIGLITTYIIDYDGIMHFITNGNIDNLSNYSRGNMRARVDMDISYNHNADEAISIAKDVCNQMADDEDIVEVPIVSGIEMIENQEMVLRVSAQTKNMMQWDIQRKLWKALKEAFDKNGIEMPSHHQVNVIKNQED